MAFRLRSTESVPDGLRRLARKELSSVSKRLEGKAHPDEEAIHEARKSVKKVRAILQLVDADNAQGVGKSSKRLRAINRRLSTLRDADAMLRILNTLRDRDRVLNERSFARVRRRLASLKQSAMKAAAR